jgi:hypothetical protein
MDPPGIQLDEEQHVQPPQPDSLDGEEVAGHDPGRLLPEERLPSRGRPARGRIEPMTSERCAGGSSVTVPNPGLHEPAAHKRPSSFRSHTLSPDFMLQSVTAEAGQAGLLLP